MQAEPKATPTEIKLSIRYLAEFLLRSGSIDSRFSGLDRGAEGSHIHRKLQRQGGSRYKAEVPLSLAIEQGNITYQLSGRADGIITGEDGSLTVDEIKTISSPIETLEQDSHPAHWAQGCLYAHILCSKHQLNTISVQLTYYQVDTDEIKRYVKQYTAEGLQLFVQQLLEEYHKWATLQINWRAERDASLQALAFPFEEYREGQRSLAVACYNTFEQQGRLFCCAPTGIGKTISTLFPALKFMGGGEGERIFYLTAKTVARKTAEDTLALLAQKQPLALHSLTITAKDKICFLDERNCNPDVCPWANGYYDRINGALYDILQTKAPFSRDCIEQYARQYQLCPYELSLDLASWCDCIICDYNYLFDPVVHLQRFFSAQGDYIFLIDEAHNLVDRSRDMYSAPLSKAAFFSLKKNLPKQYKQMHKALSGMNSAFIALRKQCEQEKLPVLAQPDMPSELQKPLERFITAAELFLEENRGSLYEQELLALYFEALFYGRIAELYDERFITLIHKRTSDVTVKLLCLDPAEFLDESLSLGRAAILFSATLEPLPYYRDTLGGGRYAKLLSLESPFPPENMGLFIADGVSTKYTDRESSLPQVAGLLADMVAAKQGNYIAYFPSYRYMRQVHELFCQQYPDIPTLVQAPGMEESARESFLAAFGSAPQQTLLGFCVMGGIFAEGVDLAGDRLIGAAVVGVGLPQIGPEPDALRSYYNEKNGYGFEYAYQFPGMNKVLQAVGRVIRSPQDKGVALLIDSRFTSARYLDLFPAHWKHWQRTTQTSLPQQLQAFWE